jgi:hypothetical protein
MDRGVRSTAVDPSRALLGGLRSSSSVDVAAEFVVAVVGGVDG